uniref:Secreted protein n=1 Tax=Rhodococcus hoagii TaxID=43767 RepID=A0A1Z1UX37_RHOHA|nr:hypothetical protein pVAPN1572_0091 [Prescottella equi]
MSPTRVAGSFLVLMAFGSAAVDADLAKDNGWDAGSRITIGAQTFTITALVDDSLYSHQPGIEQYRPTTRRDVSSAQVAHGFGMCWRRRKLPSNESVSRCSAMTDQVGRLPAGTCHLRR